MEPASGEGGLLDGRTGEVYKFMDEELPLHIVKNGQFLDGGVRVAVALEAER